MDRIFKVCQIVAIAYYLLLITGNECQTTPLTPANGNEIDKLISEIFNIPPATQAEAGNRGGSGEVYPQPQPQPTPQPQPSYPATQPTVVQPETHYPPPTVPPPVHQEPEYKPPPPPSQYPPPTDHPTGSYPPKPSEVPVSDPNPENGPNVSVIICLIKDHSVQLIDFIRQQFLAMRSRWMCAVLSMRQWFDHHIWWRNFGWYAKLIIHTLIQKEKPIDLLLFLIFPVRFGEEDNPDKAFHPCKGLFQTCCSLKTDMPRIPIIEKKEGCGYRNHEGVGFRITGEKDNEAQYGEFPWMVSQSETVIRDAVRNLIGIWHWMFQVAIIKEEPSLQDVLNVYQCGGSLIHPSVWISVN